MKTSRRSTVDNPRRPAIKPWRPTVDGRLPTFLFVLALVFSGCKPKSKFPEANLPLPPGADSGVYAGQYIQTDYGFGFPLPPKWQWLRLSAEQEVDEVARFADPTGDMMARISVQLLGEGQALSKKGWEESSEKDLENHQFKIQKEDPAQEWKTEDSGPWVEIPYRVTDGRGADWFDEEWALGKGDLLIGVHALVPGNEAGGEGGRKFLKSLEGALTQIHWYRPIGPRGISLDRYQLQQFTEGFCGALESRSASRAGDYFDDMFPDRTKWDTWYQQAVAGDPQTFQLKAELSGLVINGDLATATFALTRKNTGSAAQKFDKSFSLSKKEGSWKIMASLDKK